jgi:hypothetical protein
MNDFERQWRSLSNSGHSGGRLRVYPDHSLDFFIDYSLSGNRELIIEATGVKIPFDPLPTFENIDVVVRETSTGVRLGLTLVDNELAKSFSVMCYDIAERSKQGESVEASTVIAIECLRAWALLLKRKSRSGITRNEAIGLWGELCTIESLLAAQPENYYQIIHGWRGPNGDQRDVGFNGTRIEIKTQLSTRALGLHITSLDQLDDKGERLTVVLNRISPSDKGYSLVVLIQRLDEILAASSTIQSEFERKIELAGFDPKVDSCREPFDLDERFVYLVDNDFPRLTPSNVPVGISGADYEIAGASIARFQISWDQLVENLSEQP